MPFRRKGMPIHTTPEAHMFLPAPTPTLTPTPTKMQVKGLLIPGNIDPFKRKSYPNPDGSSSSTLSMSFGNAQGEVLIPTMVGGVRLSPQAAIKHYQQSGEHLGIFDTPDNATAYATWLSNEQGRRGEQRRMVETPRKK